MAVGGNGIARFGGFSPVFRPLFTRIVSLHIRIPLTWHKAVTLERGVQTITPADFLALHVASKRKSRTGEEYRNLLQVHVLPAIGSKCILDVRRADLAKLHGKLVDTPYQANRAMALVSAIWNWAARRDEVAVAENPAKAIERYPERGRERFLTSEELARLGDALRDGETVGLAYEVDETKSASSSPG
jgi:integrase